MPAPGMLYEYKMLQVDSSGNPIGGSGASAEQIQGTAADGATAVGNPVQIGGVSGSGNVEALLTDTSGRPQVVIANTTAQQDAAANGSWGGVQGPNGPAFGIGVAPSGLNAAGSWDRIRTAPGAANTAGIGLLGAGLLGWDGAAFQLARLGKTDGTAVGTTGVLAGAMHGWDGTGYSACKVESSTNPNLRATLYDGSQKSVITTAGDTAGLASAFRTSAILTGYNGASSDLLRNASATGAAGGTVGFLATALAMWNGSGYQPAVGDTTGAQRVSPYSTALTPTVTVSTSPAYTGGDSIGGKLTLTGAARVTGSGGRIIGIVFTDKADQTAAIIDIDFFNADPSGSTLTDNAAPSIPDADAFKWVGRVSLATTDFIQFNGNKVASKRDFILPYHCAAGTSLFAVMKTAGTPTYGATTDVQLLVEVRQD